jgi:hypothetical protein
MLMVRAAIYLAHQGYTLRSGGALGADTAFERGADHARGAKEIYRTVHATPKAMALAKSIHPNWSACSQYARQLHARNCFQVLGQDLNDPVQFVLCWTPNGEPVGGTRTAIVLAQRNGIPVLNLALDADRQRVEAKIGS